MKMYNTNTIFVGYIPEMCNTGCLILSKTVYNLFRPAQWYVHAEPINKALQYRDIPTSMERSIS